MPLKPSMRKRPNLALLRPFLLISVPEDNVRLGVFVYDEGTVSGLYGTTVLPSQKELRAAGLL